MININDVIDNADVRISEVIDYVTRQLRRILRQNGIPREVAEKYSAMPVHGGEWLLDDGDELLSEDIHLLNNDYIVETVKELEGLD